MIFIGCQNFNNLINIDMILINLYASNVSIDNIFFLHYWLNVGIRTSNFSLNLKEFIIHIRKHTIWRFLNT